jgi:DNA-binding PadR family transcriptional regulator
VPRVFSSSGFPGISLKRIAHDFKQCLVLFVLLYFTVTNSTLLLTVTLLSPDTHCMDTPGTNRKNSRHTPAFVLLFLNETPANGADLLSRMEAEMPHCLSDSAGLYRSLQSLEKEGSVKTSWETQGAGSPRKMYTITEEGRANLRAFADDIRMRTENFSFFLNRFKSHKEN